MLKKNHTHGSNVIDSSSAFSDYQSLPIQFTGNNKNQKGEIEDMKSLSMAALSKPSLKQFSIASHSIASSSSKQQPHQQSAGVIRLGVPLQVFSMEAQFFRREARSKKDLNFMKASHQQNSHLMSLQQSQAEQETINESSFLLNPRNHQNGNNYSLSKLQQQQQQQRSVGGQVGGSQQRAPKKKHVITAIVNAKPAEASLSKFKQKPPAVQTQESLISLKKSEDDMIVVPQLEDQAQQHPGAAQQEDKAPQSPGTKTLEKSYVLQHETSAVEEPSSKANENCRVKSEVFRFASQSDEGDRSKNEAGDSQALPQQRRQTHQVSRQKKPRAGDVGRPNKQQAALVKDETTSLYRKSYEKEINEPKNAAADFREFGLVSHAGQEQSAGALHKTGHGGNSHAMPGGGGGGNKDLADVMTDQKMNAVNSLISTELLEQDLLAMSQNLKAASSKFAEKEPTRVFVVEQKTTSGLRRRQQQRTSKYSNVSTLKCSRKGSVINNHDIITNRSDKSRPSQLELSSERRRNLKVRSPLLPDKSKSKLEEANEELTRQNPLALQMNPTEDLYQAQQNVEARQIAQDLRSEVTGSHRRRAGYTDGMQSESMIFEAPQLEPKINASSLIDAASDTLQSNTYHQYNDWGDAAKQAQEQLLEKVQKKSIVFGQRILPKPKITNQPSHRRKKSSLFGNGAQSVPGVYGNGKLQVSQGTQMSDKHDTLDAKDDYKAEEPQLDSAEQAKTIPLSKSPAVVQATKGRDYQDMLLQKQCKQASDESALVVNSLNSESADKLKMYGVPILHHRHQALALQNRQYEQHQHEHAGRRAMHHHQSAKQQLSQVLHSHQHQRSTALLPTKKFLSANNNQSMFNLSGYQLETMASDMQPSEKQENIFKFSLHSPAKGSRRLLAQEQQAEYYQRIIHHKNSLMQKRHILGPHQIAGSLQAQSRDQGQPNQNYYTSCKTSSSRRRITANLKFKQHVNANQPKSSNYAARKDAADKSLSRIALKERLLAQKQNFHRFQNDLYTGNQSLDSVSNHYPQPSMSSNVRSLTLEDHRHPHSYNSLQDVLMRSQSPDKSENPNGNSKSQVNCGSIDLTGNNGFQTQLPSGIDLEKVRIVMSERRRQPATTTINTDSQHNQSSQGSSSQNHNNERSLTTEEQVKNSRKQPGKQKRWQRTEADVVSSNGRDAYYGSDSRQQVVHTLNDIPVKKNCLSIVISSQEEANSEQRLLEELIADQLINPKQNSSPIWQDLVRDEFSLIKCPQNAFGSKGYNLEMDKSTLSQHVISILKANLLNKQELTSLPKPYLIKQQKPSVSEQSLLNQKLQKYKDTSQTYSDRSLREEPAAFVIRRKEPRGVQGSAELRMRFSSSQHRCQRNHERRYFLSSNRADKLTKSTGQESYQYNTRGSQYRSRMEPIQSLGQNGGDLSNFAQINPTTMAQWQRHCSPEAIQAQIMKLQALKIEKLNIDYKLVDRTCDERPYMVSEDEKEDEDEDDDDKTAQSQMQPAQNVKGASAHLDHDSVARNKRAVNSGVETASAGRLSKNLAIDKSLVDSPDQQFSKERNSTSSPFAAPGSNQAAHQKSAQSKKAGEASAAQTLATQLAESGRSRKDLGGGLSRRHLRNKLPNSPSLSLLNQVPSEHFLKLSHLMKQVHASQKQHTLASFSHAQDASCGGLTDDQAIVPNGSHQHVPTGVSAIGSKSIDRSRHLITEAGEAGREDDSMLPMRRPLQQPVHSLASGGLGRQRAHFSGIEEDQPGDDVQKAAALQGDMQQHRVLKKQKRKYARNQQIKLLRTTESSKHTNVAGNLDSLLELYKVPSSQELNNGNLKNSFRSFNSHLQVTTSAQPLGQSKSYNTQSTSQQTQQLVTGVAGAMSSKRITSKLAQNTKSTQLVRDASVKFIEGNAGEYFETQMQDGPSLAEMQQREQKYKSIKIVSKPKVGNYSQPNRASPRVSHNHLVPAAPTFELLQISHPSSYGAQHVGRQVRGHFEAKERQSQRSTRAADRVVVFEGADQLASSQATRERDPRSHGAASVKRESPNKPGFDPIQQKNFTPGLEAGETAKMARALNSKSPKRFYQVHRENKQVQNAYFPQL